MYALFKIIAASIAVRALFIGLAVLAVSQDQKPVIVFRPFGPAPRWGKGELQGRTYRNASLGIQLTPPPSLEFTSPEVKGAPGTLPLLVTITAMSEPNASMARKVMTFSSDALAYYPSTRRSTDAYMLRIVRSQQNNGYEQVESTSQEKLGGVVFMRQDFSKGDGYESIFVKACEAQALVFIFGGTDREVVDKLSKATELKIDPATSRCLPTSGSRVQK